MLLLPTWAPLPDPSVSKDVYISVNLFLYLTLEKSPPYIVRTYTTLSYWPVTEHHPLSSRGGDRQLEGCVEIVLLFMGAMNHLSFPNHQEARVTEVTSVQPVTLPIQNHNTGCAAAYKTE